MRQEFAKLETAKIDSICTRFYYTNIQCIHYRMVIHYAGNVMYKDFETYQEYKKNHDRLVRAMHENRVIPNTFDAIGREEHLTRLATC